MRKRKTAIKGGWCSWPNREYMRPFTDLARMGARCDAWRAFLDSKTVAILRRMKGAVIWFNQYEAFDKMICEFDCSVARLAAVLSKLMLPDRRYRPTFTRNDIYDARAWAKIPLDCFVPVKDMKPRTRLDGMWQNEVLPANEVPLLSFGVKVPWTVSRDCFTLRHRIKRSDGRRYAVLTFSHKQLDPRFENRRWCADGTFPRDMELGAVRAALWEKVERECKQYLVTVTEVPRCHGT